MAGYSIVDLIFAGPVFFRDSVSLAGMSYSLGNEAEPTVFPRMGLASHAAPSYQALRNTADPFDSIRTSHPRTVVEIREATTQTEDDPYFLPPVLAIVPYRPIQMHHPSPTFGKLMSWM